ncbi:MAG: alpha/beta hydrolase [Candidatus Falkowbacteria bacterium]|nr:alpha/beta hydrolase [Candidatus Falkowbacteria bacterium]
MEKIFIENKLGEKIAILIDKAVKPAGLAFIAHGLGDNKDSLHIQKIAEIFLNNNYSVVRFDTRNTFGESAGKFEDATVTNYLEDLEEVINWSKKQDFFISPFILCGHSIGSMTAAVYAEKHPQEVKALAPFSAVVNAELSKEQYSPEELKNWQDSGWLVEDWDGREIRLKYAYWQSKMKYDLLPAVDKLTMPVLLVVGENDHCTLPRHQKILFDRLSGEKEFHIIKDAPHTFRSEKNLQELQIILDNWLKTLN